MRAVEIARHTSEYTAAMAALNCFDLNPELEQVGIESGDAYPDGRIVEVSFEAVSDVEQAKAVIDIQKGFIVGGFGMPLQHDFLGASVAGLLRLGRKIDSGLIESSKDLRRIGKVVRNVGRFSVEHFRRTPSYFFPDTEKVHSSLFTLRPILERKVQIEITEAFE